jgi:peptidoglycan/LPS O-acetylase OafA/YrhL
VAASLCRKQQEDDLQKPHQFVTLDGLRGVAALTVVLFHASPLFGLNIFRNGYLHEGYLAVDFFFLLSGFVITYAYQQKLDRDLPTTEFFKTRMARLYPLYFLGLLIGGAFSVVQMHAASPRHTPWGIAGVFLLGALWIPMPVSLLGFSSNIFPLNFPSWSLFYEVCVNIVHALFVRRKGWIYLGAVVLISGLARVVGAEHLHTVDAGNTRQGILYAFPRVIFSYFMGNRLFALWKSGRVRFRIPALGSALILVVVLAMPVSQHLQLRYELIVTLLVFPVLLLASVSAQPPRGLVKLFQAMGKSSYAIYVLHMPLEKFFERYCVHIVGHTATRDAPWSGICFMLLVVVVAFVADRFYDLPVRAYLGARLGTSSTNKNQTMAA